MRILFLSILTLMFSVTSFAAGVASPVGYWKTIDDVTGEAKSIIQISENSQHELEGTVVKILKINPANPKEICKACEGRLHNQPIVGMTIMTRLHPSQDEWTGGKILDPASGKTYKCKLHLVDANQLNVRGYIGMPLLGRTQTWWRVKGA